MEKYVDPIFENKSAEEITEIIVKMNRLLLNRKKHIKKYNKLRNLHSEILYHMDDFISEGNYKVDLMRYIMQEKKYFSFDFELHLDAENPDDFSILEEIYMYKNHKNIPSVTDIYLEKKKFRNADKVKMLESMKNSYASLFKIVGVDKENGYVTYLDVFSGKKYKIIDIAMSSTLKIDKKNDIYIYNRIITFDDISFATGIHCLFNSKNQELKKFIDKYRQKRCSDLVRCLILYDISKKGEKILSTYNHQYGYR